MSKADAKPDYEPGPFESAKFDAYRAPYRKALDTIRSLDYSEEDLIHYFPAFTGHLTLARYFTFYECYKKTLGVAGHIAEIGVYKGAVSLLFAKLIQLYEPHALTQVHGFDWFQGMLPGEGDRNMPEGGYTESFERVDALIKGQQLDHIFKLHNMDVISGLGPFLDQWKHMQFKLVFMDAGAQEVVRATLPLLWDRLTPGGILVLDQYNFDIAPGETMAVRDILPNAKVRTFPNGWMPTAYIEKE